jgi:hypothetical protein
MLGLGERTGFGFGEDSSSFTIFTASVCASLLGDSDLRRLVGFSFTSLIGEDLPDVGSRGGLWNGLPLPISTLPRCCLMRLISDIQAGWAGGGCFNLGDSGLFNALSNQLDLLGLHRFDGLGGDVSSGCSLGSLNVEATDLLRL